jgi:hypothetical protein
VPGIPELRPWDSGNRDHESLEQSNNHRKGGSIPIHVKSSLQVYETISSKSVAEGCDQDQHGRCSFRFRNSSWFRQSYTCTGSKGQVLVYV